MALNKYKNPQRRRLRCRRRRRLHFINLDQTFENFQIGNETKI